MPPLGVGESLTARRLTASHLADETNPLDSVSIGLTVERRRQSQSPIYFSVRRATRPSRRCGPHRPPNTIELSLLSSNLFPPPGEAYPSDVLSLTISHRMLPEPPQFRVSLLPTRRGDYPSGSVALVSCQDVDAVSRWAPMLAVRMRRSSIRCRESRSPVGCCESLLVGRPKLFICLADRTHPSVGGGGGIIGGFMGPLGQISPSVL